MKKIIFYGVVITAISLTSCAKEYTCDCEIEHKESGNGYNYSYKITSDTKMKAKEQSASSACEGLDYSESETDGGGYKQELIQKCRLK